VSGPRAATSLRSVAETPAKSRQPSSWVVGIPWRGQGIATEAVRALIAWLGQQSVPTVIAHTHPATKHPPPSLPRPGSPPPVSRKTEK